MNEECENSIGRLQEFCVKNTFPLPQYSDGLKSGPEHQPIYQIHCSLFKYKEFGYGNSKKAAKKIAAQKILSLVLKDNKSQSNYKTNEELNPNIGNSLFKNELNVVPSHTAIITSSSGLDLEAPKSYLKAPDDKHTQCILMKTCNMLYDNGIFQKKSYFAAEDVVNRNKQSDVLHDLELCLDPAIASSSKSFLQFLYLSDENDGYLKPQTLCKNHPSKKVLNPIGKLQEFCVKIGVKTPVYSAVLKYGKIHQPIFRICCNISKFEEWGSGLTKQIAKSIAASKILFLLMDYVDCQDLTTNQNLGMDKICSLDESVNLTTSVVSLDLNNDPNKFNCQTNTDRKLNIDSKFEDVFVKNSKADELLASHESSSLQQTKDSTLSQHLCSSSEPILKEREALANLPVRSYSFWDLHFLNDKNEGYLSKLSNINLSPKKVTLEHDSETIKYPMDLSILNQTKVSGWDQHKSDHELQSDKCKEVIEVDTKRKQTNMVFPGILDEHKELIESIANRIEFEVIPLEVAISSVIPPDPEPVMDLLRMCRAYGLPDPVYTDVPNSPPFTVLCSVYSYSQLGTGTKKRIAKRNASENLLSFLKKLVDRRV